MLTTELLKTNKHLEGLTDEQLTAIETMSRNNENEIIGARFSEVYRRFDEMTAKESGIARNGDEKTYDYVPRAIAELKKQLTAQTKKLEGYEELKNEKARLEKVIAESGTDEETKKAYEQQKKELESVQRKYTELKGEYEKAQNAFEAEKFGMRIDAELRGAMANIQLKQSLPKSVTDLIVEKAFNQIKGMNPEYVDDGKGGKVLAFKEADGTIARNAENSLEPFTASELLKKTLKGFDALEETQKTTGAAAQQQMPTNVTSLSGARTQEQAYEQIKQKLMGAGLAVGSTEYQEAFDKEWVENKISQLPIK